MIMKLKLYSILSLLLCFAACTPQDLTPESAQPASLSLNLSIPGLRIETKGNADDPFADDISSWTDWEKVLDGRMLYRLTVFLIEKDSENLVAYRDIYYSTYSGSDVTAPSAEEGPNGWYNGSTVDVSMASSTQAQLSFLYDHPLHKATDGSSFEQLQRGTYRLLAVANYSGVKGTKFNGQPASVASYTGLGNGSFDASVDGVIAEFKSCQESKSPKKFSDYTNFSAFIDYTLTSSSTTFICRPMPQPLTLAKEIELNPGMNSVSGELLRSFSRIRLTVENMANVDLTLHSLAFSNNTTKDKTYLFDLPDYPDRIYSVGTKGKPSVSSSDAIVSFGDNTVLSKLSSGNNIKTVFDAYILESRDLVNDYTYTLNLEYVGEASVPVYNKTLTPVSKVSALADSIYLFQNQNNQYRFLKASSDYLQTYYSTLAALPSILDETFVMRLVSVDEDGDGVTDTENVNGTEYPKYYIKTSCEGTTYYLGNPDRGATNIPMIPTIGSATVFTARDDRGGNLTFWSNTENSPGSGVRDFINVYGGEQDKVKGWSDNDGGSQFKLYPIKTTYKTPAYSDPIILTTIDPGTSIPMPVNTIKRNDFINITVSVVYNKEFGDFEFEVKPWKEVSGDIEFN